MKNRWNELSSSILSHDNISSMFEEYDNLFHASGAFYRELEKWPESAEINEIEFIDNWIENRLIYLDTYFNNLN